MIDKRFSVDTEALVELEMCSEFRLLVGGDQEMARERGCDAGSNWVGCCDGLAIRGPAALVRSEMDLVGNNPVEKLLLVVAVLNIEMDLENLLPFCVCCEGRWGSVMFTIERRDGLRVVVDAVENEPVSTLSFDSFELTLRRD